MNHFGFSVYAFSYSNTYLVCGRLCVNCVWRVRVSEFVWCIHATVLVWGSKGVLRGWSSLPTSFETGLLSGHCVHKATWTMSFQGSACPYLPFHWRSAGITAMHCHSSLTWTQVSSWIGCSGRPKMASLQCGVLVANIQTPHFPTSWPLSLHDYVVCSFVDWFLYCFV